MWTVESGYSNRPCLYQKHSGTLFDGVKKLSPHFPRSLHCHRPFRWFVLKFDHIFRKMRSGISRQYLRTVEIVKFFRLLLFVESNFRYPDRSTSSSVCTIMTESGAINSNWSFYSWTNPSETDKTILCTTQLNVRTKRRHYQ